MHKIKHISSKKTNDQTKLHLEHAKYLNSVIPRKHSYLPKAVLKQRPILYGLKEDREVHTAGIIQQSAPYSTLQNFRRPWSNSHHLKRTFL